MSGYNPILGYDSHGIPVSNLIDRLVQISTTLPAGVTIESGEQYEKIQRERIEAALAQYGVLS
jgi:hypothetical protein